MVRTLYSFKNQLLFFLPEDNKLKGTRNRAMDQPEAVAVIQVKMRLPGPQQVLLWSMWQKGLPAGRTGRTGVLRRGGIPTAHPPSLDGAFQLPTRTTLRGAKDRFGARDPISYRLSGTA